ncbi:hypothetical protein ACJJIW_17730 [Microbulbifer sp. JMSA004]|uniref:hypothetical protein n=1 Tax=Microbulbifer sp. JMSA004 TaxID=3243370 RepID=UPI004039971B
MEEFKGDSMVVHAQISGIKINNPNSGEVIEVLGVSISELMGGSLRYLIMRKAIIHGNVNILMAMPACSLFLLASQ